MQDGPRNEWEATAPTKPRPSNAFTRCKRLATLRASTSMETDPQPGQRVIRCDRVGVYWWHRQMIETGASERDKLRRTRNTGCPCMLDDPAAHPPEHRSSRKKDVVQRSMCSPHHPPRPIAKAIFYLPVSNSTVFDDSGCLPYLR